MRPKVTHEHEILTQKTFANTKGQDSRPLRTRPNSGKRKAQKECDLYKTT